MNLRERLVNFQRERERERERERIACVCAFGARPSPTRPRCTLCTKLETGWASSYDSSGLLCACAAARRRRRGERQRGEQLTCKLSKRPPSNWWGIPRAPPPPTPPHKLYFQSSRKSLQSSQGCWRTGRSGAVPRDARANLKPAWRARACAAHARAVSPARAYSAQKVIWRLYIRKYNKRARALEMVRSSSKTSPSLIFHVA